MNTKMLTTAKFAALLDDIKENVERGETLEGTLRYRSIIPGQFEVFAAIRIGGLMGQGGVMLVEGQPVFAEGWAGKTYVRLEGDPYRDAKARILIDGEEAEIIGRELYRDGGTIFIKTDKGNFAQGNKIGVEPRPQPPYWEGVIIEPVEPME